MKRYLKIAGGIAAIALFGAAGLYGTDAILPDGAARGSTGGEEAQPTRVSVAATEQRRIEDTVTAVGTLRPVREVQLRPSVSGRVAEIGVTSGQTVTEGELIVQLDAGAERAALDEAEATLREARQNFRRIEELAASNAAAENQLEAARATLSRAEAAVSRAEVALENRRVTAPFDGTVGLIDTDPGEYIDPQTSVATLSDLSVMRADMGLPERYYARVEAGQPVEIEVPAYEGETFMGRITVRAPGVSADSRSFEVRAEVPNDARRLVGGMFARSRIVFGTHDGLAVPDDAVIGEGLSTYVFTVSEGTARRREVRLGASTGTRTEVIEGLDAGTEVVVAGWDTLSDGAPVTVGEDVPEESLE